jgi:hypothetical protein
LTNEYRSPEESQRFSGVFALKPAAHPSSTGGSSVVGTLAGEVMINTYGVGALVDLAAATLRESYGDLKAPWDITPGAFNHHDRAAMDRFHRQMPHLAAKIDEYFKFNNVLDEFESPNGPIVLLNFDAEVKMNALKKYPKLHGFYRKVVPAVTASSAIIDPRGNYWMRTQFERGHIRVTIMDRNGTLTPFNNAWKPAGESVALNQIEHGGYRTIASVFVNSMAMQFGLENISFATDYIRNPEQVVFDNRMNGVPQLVAPPGIHKMMDLIAGQFLRVLAQGNGGTKSKLSSRRLADGLYLWAAGANAELDYSPTLEFLARVGDKIAQEHNEEVRAEERAFGEELFDAFVADYNAARPAILALDGEQDRRSPPRHDDTK